MNRRAQVVAVLPTVAVILAAFAALAWWRHVEEASWKSAIRSVRVDDGA